MSRLPERSPVPAPSDAVRACIGVGSNLDDPVAQVLRALDALRSLPRTRWVGSSSLYRSRPLGDAPQPDYINAVAVVDTGLDARELLSELMRIEKAQGRERAGRWASRTLDLDLLVHGEERRTGDELTLPHPGIASREFVLVPLCEVAPGLVVPGLGPLDRYLEALDRRGLQRLEAP